MNTTAVWLTVAGLVIVPVGYNESQQWDSIHADTKHNEQDAVQAADTNANVRAIKESIERQEGLLRDLNDRLLEQPKK